MNEFSTEAVSRIDRELKAFTGDRYEAAMKKDVAEALKSFCRQNGEFAQAVADGGSFAGCMKAVAQNCGSAISDLKAYGRAAEYYFRGARVKFCMEVQLEPEETETPKREETHQEEKKGLLIDLTEFL